MTYITIIIGIAILILLLNEQEKEKIKKHKTLDEQNKKYPYRKKLLLTKVEYNFYKTLKEECDKRNYLICPKVRMEDFLEVTTKTEQLKYRGYIKSRHIDFMICDSDLRILCGIELDDQSHYSTKAQETDRLKNNIFKEVGIPLYRIAVGHGSYKEQLEAAFYTLKKKNEESEHGEIPLQKDK